MTEQPPDYTEPLTEIATSVFEEHASEIPPTSLETYPDCWDSCERVVSRLNDRNDIPTHSVDIVEVMLPNEYRHYVVVLTTPDGVQYVIDPTFGQFSSDYDSPVTVAITEKITHAVAHQKPHYIFEEQIV